MCRLLASRRIPVRKLLPPDSAALARYLRAKSPTTHRNYLRAGTQTDVRREVFTSINRSSRGRTGTGIRAPIFRSNSALGGRSGRRSGTAVRKKAGIEGKRYIEH